MAKRIEEHEISQKEIDEYISTFLCGIFGAVAQEFSIKELRDRILETRQKPNVKIEGLTDEQVVAAVQNFFKEFPRIGLGNVQVTVRGDQLTVSAEVSLHQRPKIDY